MRRIHWGVGLLLAGLLVTGCTDQGNPDDIIVPSDPNWNDDVSPMLVTNCAGCHSNTIRQAGFSVEGYTQLLSYTTSSNNPAVVPGDPEGSELYLRVTGDGFTKMPLQGSLPDGDIQMIYDWIEAGAPESADSQQ